MGFDLSACGVVQCVFVHQCCLSVAESHWCHFHLLMHARSPLWYDVLMQQCWCLAFCAVLALQISMLCQLICTL